MPHETWRPGTHPAIWLILILASFVTWWLGTNDSRDQLSDRVMIAAVVVIAFLKAYLVGMEFMEVRGAPNGAACPPHRMGGFARSRRNNALPRIMIRINGRCLAR